jgi:hypothetical protein
VKRGLDFGRQYSRRNAPGPPLVRCDGIRHGEPCGRVLAEAWGYGAKNYGRCCVPEHLLKPTRGRD